nr:uncharacterized protein LOC109172940 [Ipomoea batatas]
MDVLYWGGEGNGCYSVKSAYRLLSGKMLGQYDNRWIVVWNLTVPPKRVWGAYEWCWDSGGVDGFGGWLNECVQKLSVRELCHFVVICWGVWEARNKKVWEGVLSNPRHVARSSLAYLRD